jgi:hypothetical protein
MTHGALLLTSHSVLYRVETRALGVRFEEGRLLGVQHAADQRVVLEEVALPLREALVELVPARKAMGRKLMHRVWIGLAVVQYYVVVACRPCHPVERKAASLVQEHTDLTVVRQMKAAGTETLRAEREAAEAPQPHWVEEARRRLLMVPERKGSVHQK